MIRALVLLLSIAAIGAQAPTQYDPDNLGPQEVACGRPKSKKSPPCECKEHRERLREEKVSECRSISDRKKRSECIVSISPCPDVIDAESANPEGMPVVCKRTCHKARCECCAS